AGLTRTRPPAQRRGGRGRQRGGRVARLLAKSPLAIVSMVGALKASSRATRSPCWHPAAFKVRASRLLEASSNRLARTLKAAGCQQGDRVALLLAFRAPTMLTIASGDLASSRATRPPRWRPRPPLRWAGGRVRVRP